MGNVIFLVKRRQRTETHKMPYHHQIIICTRKHTAQWEAGDTGDHSWVWEHSRAMESGGWLLVRWNGFDVDYGHMVRSIIMPDGTNGAFVHERDREPWTLLQSAVWWSDEPIPEWLAKLGVQLPEDEFSRGKIRIDAGLCLLPMSRQKQIEARRNKMPDPLEHTP
jgi:hypothetical protein